MHISRKLAAVATAAVLTVGAVVGASAATVSSDKIIAKTGSGDLDIFNIEGSKLLFTVGSSTESSASGTSGTYLSVDGSCDRIYTYNDVADDASYSISGSAAVKGIDVTRTLTIIPNSVSGERDTVEITVLATNNTEETHQVGGRIFLDTMVEGNDQAPIRVAGAGALETRTQFEGDAIPVSFQAFDSLDNPVLIGTGTFAKGAGKPDVVQFLNYWENSSSALIPQIDTTQSIGDSAVNSIWLEKALAPGESVVYTAYYGLGYIDVSENSELVLGATKIDANFTVNEEGTGYNPVALTSYITNAGLVNLSNVSMSLDLPAGVSVVGDAEMQYDNLAVRAEKQNTWTLTATPSPEERTVTIVINAKSEETGAVEPVVYTYTIPAIEGAEPLPEETTAPETVAPTTTPDATSVTVPATTAAATKDEATKDEATKSEANNGTVKTGEAAPAFAILAVLIAGAGAVYFMRRRNG